MDKVSEYEKYDGLWIASAQCPDRAIMGIGVQAQFWLVEGHTRAKRLAMLEAIRDYVEIFSEQVVGFQKSGAGRSTRRKADNWCDYYTKLIDNTDPLTDGFTPTLTGDDYINHHFVWGFCRAPRDDIDDTLSYWAASVRPSWVKDHTEEYVAAVVRWAEALQPVHGTSGLAPIFEIGMERNYAAEYWPFLARFPCLDFFTAMDLCAGASDGVRTVNWLTVLCDDYIEKLGGIHAIIAGLHDLSTVHSYNGGIVIQACPHPQLGDVSLANVPAPYVAVNDLIRDFRFLDYPKRPTCLLKVPEPLDALEETANWVRRFDPKDGQE